MIHFTARGAVSTPDTLQIRVGLEMGGLRAGAPVPSRRMTKDEVLQNLRHFTTGLDTPRTRPCRRLVLSGVAEGDGQLVGVVSEARLLGVETVVVHGSGPPEVLAAADSVVIRCEDVASARGRPRIDFTAVVPLTRRAVSHLEDVVSILLEERPVRVVLVWPFPPEEVDEVEHTVLAAKVQIERLVAAGIPAQIRGLPPCLDGSEEGRTRNRYYVDADHQGERALLFWPDIVQFLKPEPCRSCAKTSVCDGVAAEWLQSGVVQGVRPLP